MFALVVQSRAQCTGLMLIIKFITIVIVVINIIISDVIIIFLLNLPGEQLASQRTGPGQRQDCRARRGSKVGSGTSEPPLREYWIILRDHFLDNSDPVKCLQPVQ